jgi:hypothetical protein
MVTIIPTGFVIHGINTIDGIGIEIIGISTVNKGVLCPVAQHHHQSRK